MPPDNNPIGIVSGLLADYAHCIDSDELERWPDFFP